MNTQQQHLDTKKACAHEFQVSCSNCRLNSICLPFSLEARDIDELDRIIQRSQHHPTLNTQLIERAAFDQGLQRASIQFPGVCARAEIKKTVKRAIVSCGQQIADRSLT